LFFQQEFEADFVSFAAAVYGTLIDGSILPVGQITKVLPEWPKIHSWRRTLVGLDPGADHPFGAVVLVETDAGFVVIREYLARHKPLAEHALAIHALVGSLRPEYWGCDRSQLQTMIELDHHGIRAVGPNNDVIGGTGRVSSWLHARRLWLPQETCPKLIDQLRSYRWDENVDAMGRVTRERVVKVHDDLCDALRYALMLWPYPPVYEDPEAPSHPGERDLSTLPEEVRWSVERLRRTENPVDTDEEFIEDGTLPAEGESPFVDFWR
jgi:hypothetical protein